MSKSEYYHTNVCHNIQAMTIKMLFVNIKNVTVALTNGIYNTTSTIQIILNAMEVMTTDAFETIFWIKLCWCKHYTTVCYLNVPVGFLASVLLLACSDFGAGMFSFRSIWRLSDIGGSAAGEVVSGRRVGWMRAEWRHFIQCNAIIIHERIENNRIFVCQRVDGVEFGGRQTDEGSEWRARFLSFRARQWMTSTWAAS